MEETYGQKKKENPKINSKKVLVFSLLQKHFAILI
jgi:hypothetical protein